MVIPDAGCLRIGRLIRAIRTTSEWLKLKPIVGLVCSIVAVVTGSRTVVFMITTMGVNVTVTVTMGNLAIFKPGFRGVTMGVCLGGISETWNKRVYDGTVSGEVRVADNVVGFMTLVENGGSRVVRDYAVVVGHVYDEGAFLHE
jgi:hypothetical protein